MKAILLTIICSTITFCTYSQDTWAEVDTTLLIDWDTFEIEPAFDFTGLMFNPLRKNRWGNYEEKTVYDHDMVTTYNSPNGTPMTTMRSSKRKVKKKILPSSHYAKKPYFGLSLGNGLFLNYSGELFFFVPEFWNLNYKTGFAIKDFDDNRTTFLHSVKNQKYIISASKKVTNKRELLTAKWDSTFNEVNIYFSRKLKNTISISNKNLQITNKKLHGEVKFDAATNKYVLSKIYKKDDYDERKLTQISAKELVLNNKRKIKLEGKALKIGGSNRLYRTKNAVYVLKGEELKMRLKITHERVDVYENGEFQSSYYNSDAEKRK